ncbi:hypothetical protein STRCI_000155 [Streptomyces cinnabarinus]|uniref:Uncharacterized protein n=1 Tax=Streptomyces cinnabarinus TaxID=67287 RepID=A0ABY7K3Q9_9ACTN|nr:hypothetical protein [Streptomyces cinnabarinus]WAZ19125.1 hypothetical protein STRCI_000155 [Streptomyces cinnabarinus]
MGSASSSSRVRPLGAYWIEEALGGDDGCVCSGAGAARAARIADSALRICLAGIGLTCMAAAVLLAVVGSGSGSAAGDPMRPTSHVVAPEARPECVQHRCADVLTDECTDRVLRAGWRPARIPRHMM